MKKVTYTRSGQVLTSAMSSGASTASIFPLSTKKRSLTLLICAAFLPFMAQGAYAACVLNGQDYTCTGSTSGTIGDGLNTPDGTTVTVDAGSTLDGGNAPAISLGNNGTITIDGLVQNNATNGNGKYPGVGANTIEANSNNRITISATGRVISSGPQTNAEAINLMGVNNVVTNYGLIEAVTGAAIWFQDEAVAAPGSQNFVINYGIVKADQGGNVIGTTHGYGIVFENKTGAQVIGNLQFANGDDNLLFENGSLVTGDIDGGGGTNHLALSGVTGSVDVLAGAVKNFESLTKFGLGRWDVTGSLIGFNDVYVTEGVLGLSGDNSGFTGLLLINNMGHAPTATVEARAQSLPTNSTGNIGNVVNNGTLRFLQNDDGTYVGQIVGQGIVEKNGTGTVTLSPEAAEGNAYAGGTFIYEGTLAVAADSALGLSTGQLSIDGGTLQLNSSFDLSSARLIMIGNNRGSGTINTQGYDSTVSQGISGIGDLIKRGTGTLNLIGNSSAFSGALYVAEGTVGVIDNGVINPNGVYVGTSLSAPTAGSGTLRLATNGSIASRSNVQIARDAGSTGTLVIGGGASAPGALSAPQVQFGAGNGALIFDHNSDAYQFDAGISGGISGKGLIYAVAGRTILAQNSSVFTGDTLINSGILQVNNELGGTMTVMESGRLEGVGVVGSTTTPTLNAGVIAPGIQTGGGNLFGTLTVRGDYTGQPGSFLETNTALGGDNSPTNLLVVNGNTAGTTLVKVNNRGGQGAQTYEGIRIVQVNGQSDGNFMLLSDYTAPNGLPAVVSGAFGYSLYKGATSTPDDGNWYLRSLSLLGTKPTPDTYQPGVALYESYPQVLTALNRLSTLQQRVGNRFWSDNSNTYTDKNGAWVRVEGSTGTSKPKESTSGAQYDIDIAYLQMGVDGHLYSSDSGSLIGGLTAHYGHANADVSSVVAKGTIKSDGYGIGGTLTWYGQSGFYVDGQAQATWYSSDIHSDTLRVDETNNNDGFGYALSIEAGKVYALNDKWSLTPQAQLVYSEVDFDDFTDAFGARVSNNEAKSLLGRLGLAADYSKSWMASDNDQRRMKLYGILNVYNEFLNGSKVEVSGHELSNRDDRLWVGLSFGGSYNWKNDKYSLYGELGARTSTEHFGDSYVAFGEAGLRMRF